MPILKEVPPSPTKVTYPLKKNREAVTPSWVGRVPQLKPGQYADGMPIHSPEYICCKLILRPNKFHSRESFFDFGKVFREPAKEHGVKYTTEGFIEQPVKIREVLFVDTDDFRLYNNAFILRRRIPYEDGFPIGEPEIVFKFRHPDLQMCAETDVRPNILGDHRVKFKVQALPLKEKLGGIRLLYSHNVQFPRSAVGIGPFGQEDTLDVDTMVRVFPVLARVKKQPGEKIKLVSDTIIEEVLQDIGMLDFGDGLNLQGQRGHLAYPRRASPAHRRVRVSVQIQGPLPVQPRCPSPHRGVLYRTSVLRRRLHQPGCNQDCDGLPLAGESSQIARMIRPISLSRKPRLSLSVAAFLKIISLVQRLPLTF
jgi:hypothetical protein